MAKPFDWVNDKLTVQIKIKDPSSHTEDGEVTYYPEMDKWTDLEIITPASTCKHETTGCNDCLDDWVLDYFMRISNDNGATWYGANDVPGYEPVKD